MWAIVPDWSYPWLNVGISARCAHNDVIWIHSMPTFYFFIYGDVTNYSYLTQIHSSRKQHKQHLLITSSPYSFPGSIWCTRPDHVRCQSVSQMMGLVASPPALARQLVNSWHSFFLGSAITENYNPSHAEGMFRCIFSPSWWRVLLASPAAMQFYEGMTKLPHCFRWASSG